MKCRRVWNFAGSTLFIETFLLVGHILTILACDPDEQVIHMFVLHKTADAATAVSTPPTMYLVRYLRKMQTDAAYIKCSQLKHKFILFNI